MPGLNEEDYEEYAPGLLQRLASNFQVKVENIYISFEDPKGKSSFGIKIPEINIDSVRKVGWDLVSKINEDCDTFDAEQHKTIAIAGLSIFVNQGSKYKRMH